MQSQVEYSITNAYAYPTLTRTPVPDPTGQHGSTTALISTSYTTGNPDGERTFDAENRVIAAQFMGEKESWAYYTYNGDGQRVRRNVEGYEIWQVYGFDGELLAEYPRTGPSVVVAQPQKEYGYRDGQLLVTTEPWVNLALNMPACAFFTAEKCPLMASSTMIVNFIHRSIFSAEIRL